MDSENLASKLLFLFQLPDGFADAAGGGAEDGVLVGTLGSHVDIGVGEEHLTAERFARREVELVDGGGFVYASDVLLVDATAG